jgi:hypothetical protein
VRRQKRREPFTSRCKVWKLKELEIRSDFQQRIRDKAIEREDGDVDFIWCSLRECLLEVADEVCGKTKGNQRHSQTWWWNDDVAQVISEKQRLYKLYDKSKKEGDKTEMEENRKLYQVAKCEAKRAVYKAQEEERKKFGEMLDEEDGKGNIFRVAKQIVRSNKDVVGSGCVKDGNGKIVVDDQKILEVWKAHYDKISNEEFR